MNTCRNQNLHLLILVIPLILPIPPILVIYLIVYSLEAIPTIPMLRITIRSIPLIATTIILTILPIVIIIIPTIVFAIPAIPEIPLLWYSPGKTYFAAGAVGRPRFSAGYSAGESGPTQVLKESAHQSETSICLYTHVIIWRGTADSRTGNKLTIKGFTNKTHNLCIRNIRCMIEFHQVGVTACN